MDIINKNVKDVAKAIRANIAQKRKKISIELKIFDIVGDEEYRSITATFQEHYFYRHPALFVNKDDNILEYSCDCRVSDDGNVCDHVLLIIDEYYRLKSKKELKNIEVITHKGNLYIHNRPTKKDEYRVVRRWKID